MKLKKIPLSAIESAINSNDYMGFCLACGEEAYGVEPDARKYECESCGEKEVYGAEEILMMGMVSETDEEDDDEDEDGDEDFDEDEDEDLDEEENYNSSHPSKGYEETLWDC